MQRTRIVLIFTVLTVLVFVTVLFDKNIFKSWLRVSFSKTFHGETLVKVGDRFSYIDFNEAFDSPPRVNVSPKSRDATGFRIRDISREGFMLELYERAPTNLYFSWLAEWDRWDQVKFYDIDAGLPETLGVQVQGNSIKVQYTGSVDFIPTEFWIPSYELPNLDIDDQVLIGNVLEESFKLYSQDHTCSVLQKLKKLLRIRAKECPARIIDNTLPKWANPDIGDWRVQREKSGLRIVKSSSVVKVLTDDMLAEKLSTLLKTASLFDVMRHNNQVLDVLDVAAAESLETPLTIIHFDTHSDLSVYKDPRTFFATEGISDFMNTLISRGLVREVFWVLPDWTKNAIHQDAFWVEEVSEFQGALHKRGHYEKGPKTLSVYVDSETGLAYMPNKPSNIEFNRLKHVPFHKVTLDELPDLSRRTNLYLEIDADYLSNAGYHTRNYGNSNPSHTELIALLQRIATTLVNRGASPSIVSLCLSPLFVSIEDRGYLTKIFLDAARLAGLSDYLVGYRHMDTIGATASANNVRRSSVASRLVLDLVELDARTPGVDERIFISDRDPEYNEAISLIQGSFDLTAYDAESIMLKLDLFDGRNDGMIDLVGVEYYTALENLDWILERPAFQDWPKPYGQIN